MNLGRLLELHLAEERRVKRLVLPPEECLARVRVWLGRGRIAAEAGDMIRRRAAWKERAEQGRSDLAVTGNNAAEAASVPTPGGADVPGSSQPGAVKLGAPGGAPGVGLPRVGLRSVAPKCLASASFPGLFARARGDG
jgi:hypothetical protein